MSAFSDSPTYGRSSTRSHNNSDGASDQAKLQASLGDEGHETRSKRTRHMNKLACSRCRGMKARCELHEPANGKCTRCTRLSFECVWVEPQKRGRRATNSRPSDQTMKGRRNNLSSAEAAAGSIYNFSILSTAKDTALASTDTDAGNMSSRAAPHTSPPAHYSLIKSNSVRQSHSRPNPTDDSPAEPSPQSASQRSYNRSESAREGISPQAKLPSLSMMDLAQAKEKALQGLDTSTPLPAPPKEFRADVQPEADPIDMHVLSELDAHHLFEHYHRKMNGFIILLDPFLHTVQYVRKTSHTLFSTILAVSAKFIRPQLYQPLLMHAKQLVGRGIIDSKVSLGLIQSILLQVYWKEPDDSSAWVRVGEAIRMGYQLHLHRHRSEPLPNDEFQARLILDRERTWIDLCAFDQTFFLQSAEEEDGFHQTCMIPHFRISVKDWLKETISFGVEDDLEQGANFEWIKMQRLSRDIPHARPGNARALGQHVQGTLEAAYQQYLNPLSADAFLFETRQWVRVNFWLAAASLALSRAMLIAVGNEGELLAEWVVASSAFVDALEIVAKHGYIQYWQDTLGITLYSMGEFSVKIFPDVYPATQKAIVGWIDRIHRACAQCADGKTDSTAAFISRFFQLCLRAVCLRSNTPDTTRPPLGGEAGKAPLPTELRSMETVFPYSIPATNQIPLASFHDASYWESIFPGVSTDWSWLLQSLETEIPAE